jgi:aspartate/methionine/tyrosine aminotransferase
MYSGVVSTSRRATPGEPNSIATRYSELQSTGIELTDLTNTNPTRCGLFDPRILEVVSDHLPQASTYQPSPRGPWPARAALAERYGGNPDDYWLTASTSEAYSWLFTILADPGDSVAIPNPGYPLIEPLARLQSITVQPYHSFYVPTGWEVDLDSLCAALDAQVQAVVAVHPNNPTGAYCPVTVPQLAAEHGIPLIADEVFLPYFLGEGDPPPRIGDYPISSFGHPGVRPDPVVLPGHPARKSQDPGINDAVIFSLDGLSKLLAAPQLKLGWIRLSAPILSREKYAQALDAIADTYLSVNTPVALALPDLLDLAESVVPMITARLRANLAIITETFGQERVRTTHGGWMVLLDVPPMMEAEALCVELMELAGLYVHPGYFYDLPDSTLAISLLPETPIFEESCIRLNAALVVLGEKLRGIL